MQVFIFQKPERLYAKNKIIITLKLFMSVMYPVKVDLEFLKVSQRFYEL